MVSQYILIYRVKGTFAQLMTLRKKSNLKFTALSGNFKKSKTLKQLKSCVCDATMVSLSAINKSEQMSLYYSVAVNSFDVKTIPSTVDNEIRLIVTHGDSVIRQMMQDCISYHLARKIKDNPESVPFDISKVPEDSEDD